MAKPGWQCFGCFHHRAALGDYPSCKPEPRGCGRLCERIDTTLLSTLPYRTLQEYEAVTQQIQQQFAVAKLSAARQGHSTFTSPQALLDAATRAHHVIFHRDFPNEAGKFRKDPVTFGPAPHRRTGATPSAVRGALCQLATQFCNAHAVNIISATTVAMRHAHFLHEFFLIHPFFDGNGRIGRLLLELSAEQRGFSYAWPSRSGPRRSYVAALRYADNHHPKLPSTRRQPPNHLRGLARWLEHCLVCPPREEEPPSTAPP